MPYSVPTHILNDKPPAVDVTVSYDQIPQARNATPLPSTQETSRSSVPREITTSNEPVSESNDSAPKRIIPPRAAKEVHFVEQNDFTHHGPAARDVHLASELAFAHAVTSDFNEPKTLRDALIAPDADSWRTAVDTELKNLHVKDTWQEVILPPNRRAVKCRWIFTNKRDAEGHVIKHKARLVAKGFSQQPGIDFEETFAPVGRLTSLRILLAHAAAHDLMILQADVEGAYLNGKVDVELYMDIPDGITPLKPESNALRLNKTIYGLKQSSHAWWLELGTALASLGSKKLESDWGLYVRHDSGIGAPSVMLLAYVDDILVAAKTRAEAQSVIDALEKIWKMSSLGDVSHLLGLKVKRDTKTHTTYRHIPNCVHRANPRSFPRLCTSPGSKWAIPGLP